MFFFKIDIPLMIALPRQWRRSFDSVLTSKGPITLPKSLRDRLGLKSGDILEFDDDLPYVKAVPRFDAERMRSVAGRGRDQSTSSSEEWLDNMRGRVDLP